MLPLPLSTISRSSGLQTRLALALCFHPSHLPLPFGYGIPGYQVSFHLTCRVESTHVLLALSYLCLSSPFLHQLQSAGSRALTSPFTSEQSPHSSSAFLALLKAPTGLRPASQHIPSHLPTVRRHAHIFLPRPSDQAAHWSCTGLPEDRSLMDVQSTAGREL